MKKLIPMLLTVAMGAACFAAERKPMALFVFFDGGRSDCLRNAKCPNLKSLINGTWAEGYKCAWSDAGHTCDEVDTLSYANHLSLHSGTPATTHHLRFNNWVNDKKRYSPQRSWLKVLSDHGYKATAFYSDSADKAECEDEGVEIVMAGKHWPEGDFANAEHIVEALGKPDVAQALEFWVESPDCEGHYCGYYPSSKTYLDAFDKVDALLGKVLAAIKARPTFEEEDWMIAFTTDHGGKGVRHGPHSGHCETIPIVFTSRHVKNGLISGMVRNIDMAPTLLAHFGVAAEPQMTGRVQGRELSCCQPAAKLEDGIFFNTTFDQPFPRSLDSYMHGIGQYKGPTMVVSGYADEFIEVKDGFGMIDAKVNPCSIWLQKSASVFAKPFTICWWLLDAGDTYVDNPPIISNRNNHEDVLESTGAPAGGFNVWLESPTQPGGKGITFEYLGGDNKLHQLGAWQTCVGKWTFYAVVCRGDGVIMFYQGRPDGKLNWIAQNAWGAKLKGINLVLGQDGTAEHHIGFHGGFDDLTVWQRPLASSEIDAVFTRGRR